MAEKPNVQALLLGLGLDNQDGHVRVTRSEDFCLLGGSRETHEQMQEKAVRFVEAVDKRGKKLAQISPAEFHDIAVEIGLNRR
jgi:hypothetical protein